MKRTHEFRHLLVTMVFGVAAMSATAFAQMPDGGLRIGMFGAATYNYEYNGPQLFIAMPGDPGFSTADLCNADAFASYEGVFADYAFSDLVGVTLRAAYDDRSVSVTSGDRTFSTTLGYLTVEPGVSLALGIPELHFLVGGSWSYRLINTYDYNSGSPDGLKPIANADLNNVRENLFGVWGGFSYDLNVVNDLGGVSWWVTPFAETSYTIDGMKDDVGETNMWNMLSVRAGARVSIGF